MAKVKISGERDPIFVPDEIIKDIDRDRTNRELKDEDYITIQDRKQTYWSGRAGKIDWIKYEPKNDFPDEHKLQIEADNRERDRKAKLPAEVKAKDCWGHFSLFYFAFFRKKPAKEEWAKRLEAEALKFFQDNLNWTICSITVYWKMLGFTKANNPPANDFAFSVLERAEQLCIREANYRNKHWN